MEDHSNSSLNFFINNVLHQSKDVDQKLLDEKLSVFQRKNISKPIIFLGVTSSSVVGGALETREAIENYRDQTSVDFEYVEVGSIGLCSIEPIMDVQLPGKTRVSFQKVTADLVGTILDGIFNNFLPTEYVLAQYRSPLQLPWNNVPFFDELSFFNSQHRVLLANCGITSPNSIIDSFSVGGYKTFANVLRSFTHDDVCSNVEKSGLRGRGGGGFPTGKKWRKALEAGADKKYFICNADESDPGAFMDRLLMESDPHLVIEGIAISAYAIGANKAFIYTRNRYEFTVLRLENALRQAYSAGLLGDNIFDSGYNLDIVIRKGPGAYVCGEETALIQSLEGKRGMPTLKPPYPTTRGLFGKPTVVNNIETIANIPFIISKGYEWYNSIGTEKSKGTKLFSVSGKVNQTCLVEVPLGVSIARIVELGGGVAKGRKLKAVQIGGPSGGCAIPEHLNTPIDFETLKDIGLSMGSGGIIVFDDTVCMIDIVKYFMHFIQKESCGKCIPCREGSRRMLEILENITRRPVTDDGHTTLERFKGVIHLESLAEVMRDTSLCGLGQTAANPVLSTLKLFREEYEEHIFDRKCTASICRNLRTFYIDIDNCNGCAACAKKCPTNAIIGTPRSPYFIVEEKCIGCGVCEEVCKFSAVFFK
jgi:NADH:ubiquinone oxidoreductase subunit F (NADH-binding)/Pyruvate/2-oxoacid:ferredoxin oxidoreductase delta subunit